MITAYYKRVSTVLLAQSSSDLYKCVALTDPHIRTWHPNEQSGGVYKDCLGGGMYDLVRNRYVVFNIRVSNWWMVDVGLSLYVDLLYHNRSSLAYSCTCPFSMVQVSDRSVLSSLQTLKWSLVTDAT